MAVFLVICCDAEWHGFDCRGAITTRADNLTDARAYAAARGWSHNDARGDLCHSHTLALKTAEAGRA